MTEAELKALMQKAIEAHMGCDTKTFQETLNEIRGLCADDGRIKQAEDAIKQIEQTVKDLPTNIEAKMQAAARRAYDMNRNYVGSFASEDEAREFALNVIRLSTKSGDGLHTQAVEVLDADHKAFFQVAKDISGEQAIIPHQHTARIQRLVEVSSAYVGNVFRQPMTSDTMSFSRAIGGMRARKTSARSNVPSQNTTVVPVNLTAYSWDIFTSYPKDFNADALVSYAELLVMDMRDGFTIAFEEDGFIGDGTDAYDNEMGIATLLKSINGVDDGGGLVLGSGNAGDGWSGLTKDNFLKLFGQARYVQQGQGKAYGSNEFFWQVIAPIISDAGGRTMMETQSGFKMNIFGVPYEVVHTMPRVAGNSQIPMVYGDLRSSSTLGVRSQLTIDTSEHVLFRSKEIGVLASNRYAMNNHTLGDATNAGPVVGLITPAAA